MSEPARPSPSLLSHPAHPLHPSIVLSSYLEPLVRGRRVAILGEATAGLAEELAERGARLIHVYDPDAARVAEALAAVPAGATSPISHAPFTGDFGVRDGAFDVVVAPDLTLFADPADTLRRARRLVSGAGVAVLGVPNAARTRTLLGPEPSARGSARSLSYYELYDLVSLQFARVRMVGQAPFVGYTVADFAPNGEPDVSIDTSLVTRSEEPEHFLAIGSDRPTSVEPYTVVALPWSEIAASQDAHDAHDAQEAHDARPTTPPPPDPGLTAELDAARAALGEAKAAASAATARANELDADLVLRSAKLKEAEARAGDNHVRAERLSNQIRDLEEELVRQRDRGTKLSRVLDEEKRARQKAEIELGMLRGKPEVPGAKERIDALSAELESARARVAELEADKVETQRRPEPAPDAALVLRLAESERAVTTALTEARRAIAERDAEVAAREAARREAAQAARDATQSARDATQAARDAAQAARDADEATARAEGLQARVQELEARLAAAGAAASRERDAAAAALQVVKADLEAARAETRAARAALEAAREEAKQARERAAAELAEARAEALDARDRLDAASVRAAVEAAAREAAEAAAREVQALEAALYERGRVIAGLKRELTESERIGREILDDLLDAGPSNGSDGEDLRSRLDSLAASAAKREADLQAATWKIQKLERETAGHAPSDPGAVQVELERALAAARDEVASLRRELSRA